MSIWHIQHSTIVTLPIFYKIDKQRSAIAGPLWGESTVNCSLHKGPVMCPCILYILHHAWNTEATPFNCKFCHSMAQPVWLLVRDCQSEVHYQGSQYQWQLGPPFRQGSGEAGFLLSLDKHHNWFPKRCIFLVIVPYMWYTQFSCCASDSEPRPDCPLHITAMSHECYGILNHSNLNFLFNSMSRVPKRNRSKLHIDGPCQRDSLVTSGFPSQRSSNIHLLPFSIYCIMLCWHALIMNAVWAWTRACLTVALRLAIRSPLPGRGRESQYIWLALVSHSGKSLGIQDFCCHLIFSRNDFPKDGFLLLLYHTTDMHSFQFLPNIHGSGIQPIKNGSPFWVDKIHQTRDHTVQRHLIGWAHTQKFRWVSARKT